MGWGVFTGGRRPRVPYGVLLDRHCAQPRERSNRQGGAGWEARGGADSPAHDGAHSSDSCDGEASAPSLAEAGRGGHKRRRGAAGAGPWRLDRVAAGVGALYLARGGQPESQSGLSTRRCLAIQHRSPCRAAPLPCHPDCGLPPPSSPPRTKWTRRVPHPVLTGHVSSLVASIGARGAAAGQTRRQRARRDGRLRRARSAAEAAPRQQTPGDWVARRRVASFVRGVLRRLLPRGLLGSPANERALFAPPPPPFPRTNRTSLVPPLVLSGHAAFLTSY